MGSVSPITDYIELIRILKEVYQQFDLYVNSLLIHR
jgi:hypothetical protein